jgi:hypothetical protein
VTSVEIARFFLAEKVPYREPGALACVNVNLTARSFSQGVPGMSLLISALVTFLIVILILYLVNLLPLDGRAKQIVRIIVIILGVLSLLRLITW